ncbi:LuxR C-terminal-related transcriptional regulator [Rhodococcus sp. ABRD24]|uniref:helix-turn-helix transcriptional regulator n=1 Tax=Rhodococcus sp. ABRD24 TaxID=2507582 RepID=UPI0013F14A40|nr:LuxR C-terminal-related transcriptional regulator [Rhodococcus sp. ABRD24]
MHRGNWGSGPFRSGGLVLDRPRLQATLDSGSALTVLRGPRGSGKSTLVSQWLGASSASEPHRVVVSVPEPEMRCDSGVYWRSVASAARAAGIAAAEDATASSEDAFRTFCSSLADVDVPVVLVLDHPDRVADPLFRDRISEVLFRFGHVRAVAMVRTVVHFGTLDQLDLGRYVVSYADLRFTAGETAAFFEQNDLDLGREVTDRIRELVDGLPVLAGTAMSIARAFGGEFAADRGRALASLQRVIDSYVENTIMADPVVAESADFLIASSTAVDLTPRTAIMLSSDGDSLRRLIDLEYAGILMRSPIPGVLEWKMFPPVREALMRRTRVATTTRPLPASARLARFLLAEGNYSAALLHAAEAEDWDLVVVILKRGWLQLLPDHGMLLVETILALPQYAVQGEPTMSAARQMLLGYRAGWALALESVVDLDDPVLTSSSRDLAGAISVGTVQSISIRIAGEYDRAAALTKRMAELVKRAPEHGVGDPERSALQLQWGITLQLSGHYEQAVTTLRSAYMAGATAGFDWIAEKAAGLLALHFAMAGELVHAEKWIAREERHEGATGRLADLIRVPGQIARALIALERLDMVCAKSTLAELDRTFDNDEFWAFAQYAQAQYKLLTGDAERGRLHLHRAESIFGRWMTGSSAAAPLLVAAEAELLCAMGRGNEARVLVTRSHEDHSFVRLACARIELLTGNPAAALAECRLLGRKLPSFTRLQMDVAVVETLAHLDQGRVDRARRAFGRVLSLAEQTGSLRSFAALPASALEALALDAELPGAWVRLAPDYAQGIFPESVPVIELSDRERVVLGALGDATGVAEVAATLFVSPNTVKSQLRSAYRKLGVNSRQDALAKARRLGLL